MLPTQHNMDEIEKCIEIPLSHKGNHTTMVLEIANKFKNAHWWCVNERSVVERHMSPKHVIIEVMKDDVKNFEACKAINT